MKTDRNIRIAFVLNLAFSIFEFFGGFFTGSAAIISDAIHDLGDAASIGVACLLEAKSKRRPDAQFSYGYARYSVLGGLITTLILLIGSIMAIFHAAGRLVNPVEIHYDGMIVFAVVGVLVNFCAAHVTHGGHSHNQRAVNLHMLEDVLGWLAVLIGAVVMKFTDWAIIDPILSICVAAFVCLHAAGHLKEILDLFLDKTPEGINPDSLRERLLAVEGVKDVHHIHIRSLDGHNHCATMHIVCSGEASACKRAIRSILAEQGIHHATLELEKEDEACPEECCGLTEILG